MSLLGSLVIRLPFKSKYLLEQNLLWRAFGTLETALIPFRIRQGSYSFFSGHIDIHALDVKWQEYTELNSNCSISVEFNRTCSF